MVAGQFSEHFWGLCNITEGKFWQLWTQTCRRKATLGIGYEQQGVPLHARRTSSLVTNG
jgi:hypothetical protein